MLEIPNWEGEMQLWELLMEQKDARVGGICDASFVEPFVAWLVPVVVWLLAPVTCDTPLVDGIWPLGVVDSPGVVV
jgi:hypothetical protein